MNELQYKAHEYPLPYVIPDLREWPIYKLTQRRNEFTAEVRQQVFTKIRSQYPDNKTLKDELTKVLYSERVRLIEKPWKADPKDEGAFWSRMKSKIIKLDQIGLHPDERPTEDEILKDIIQRYVNEIVGSFNPSVFTFARNILPVFFGRVLNAAPGKWFKTISANAKTIHEKIPITGDIEKIRALAKKGTVIITPTHFSNMDSIMVGWVLNELGLPAFTYGAGLNLFSIKLLSYFMNNLGAYRLDRRKKNEVYLEALKTYACSAIENGAHMIFFPGGTRSRSGSLEKKLKLGLLGTAVEAQKNHFKKYNSAEAPRIFIVPCIINYHFVLEAEGLINDWLKEVGREKFLRENDSYSTSYKMIKFMLKFLSASSSLAISFGDAMDVLGNRVDAEGNSYNHLGNRIDVKHYFMTNGELTDDPQREAEYTKILGNRIVADYYRFNVVLSSHLVCFTAFELLQRRFSHVDLFTLLRAPVEDLKLSYSQLASSLEKVREQLKRMAQQKQVQLSPEVFLPVSELLEHGMKNIGHYHANSPILRQGDEIGTEDVKLMYYYHNRLDGYQLEKYV